MEYVRRINEFSGLFLVVIVWAVVSCRSILSEVRNQLDCLHEDFDTVNSAHERGVWKRENKMNEDIAAHMKKRTQ